MPPCQPLSLCLSPRKLCAASSAENTCIILCSELQSNQPETRNASRPGPVNNHRFGAGSVFDHINDHRQHRSTRKTWFQRCLKSNQNQLKIAKNHRKLPEIILSECLGPSVRGFKSLYSYFIIKVRVRSCRCSPFPNRTRRASVGGFAALRMRVPLAGLRWASIW